MRIPILSNQKFFHRTVLINLVVQFFSVLFENIEFWKHFWFILFFRINLETMESTLGSNEKLHWSKWSADPILEALNNGSLFAIESHYLHFAKLLFGLVPHITNNKLSELVFDAANECAVWVKEIIKWR